MNLKCVCPECGKTVGVEPRDCIVAQHCPKSKTVPSCIGAGQSAHAAIDVWIARELVRPPVPGDSARRSELLRIAAKRRGSA